MAATPRVVLTLEGKRVEVGTVSPQRRGALRALTREAEAKFDAYPESYNFFGGGAKVDSLASLQQALERAAPEGVCELEVRERPEWKWKKMREMDAQIQALAAKDSAFRAEVEASLRDMRVAVEQNNAKLCSGLAPVVQSLATEQMDLKAKLDEEVAPVMREFSSQQSDLTSKIDNVLAPLVQSLTMEQIELKAKLASIDVDQQKWNNDVELELGLAKEREESLGYELQLVSEGTRRAIVNTHKHQETWNKDVELVLGLAKENEESLGYELQLVIERTRLAEEGLKALQSEVQAQTTKPLQQESVGAPWVSSAVGTTLQKDTLVSFPYSRKVPHIAAASRSRLPWESPWQGGSPLGAAPFVQLYKERCQSMPQLPRVS